MDNREKRSSPSPPYPQLYIYHLNASVPCDRTLVGESFIGNWEEEDSSFLFFSKPAEETVNRLISRHNGVSLLDGYQMTYEEWQGGTVTSFQAGRFLVQPPWEVSQPPQHNTGEYESIPIILDPGVVFGTGTHPTTRDCLAALEAAYAQETATSVLDLGTGTGLLAIAAARLGARATIAVDLNLLAVRTAAENIRINGLEDRIIAMQGRAEEMMSTSADLLIANIHYDVMQHLVPSEGFLKKRVFILSGILRSQARTLEARLTDLRCSILRRWVHEDTWFTFYGKTG